MRITVRSRMNSRTRAKFMQFNVHSFRPRFSRYREERASYPSLGLSTFVLRIISDNYFIKTRSNNYSTREQIPVISDGFSLDALHGNERNNNIVEKFFFRIKRKREMNFTVDILFFVPRLPSFIFGNKFVPLRWILFIC